MAISLAPSEVKLDGHLDYSPFYNYSSSSSVSSSSFSTSSRRTNGKVKNKKRSRSRSPSGEPLSPLHPSDSYADLGQSSLTPSPSPLYTKTNGDHKRVKHEHETPQKGEVKASKEELTRVRQAIQDIKDGKFVLVVDDESRENEGDLILAAEMATTEKIAFMVNETSGLICVGCTGERLDQLRLPQMVDLNTENHQTAFTVSVDYKIGTTTGISASDRAITFRALSNPKAKPEDFARPGHVFPLRAKAGGVLERPGHTETAVDLCRLAGLFPAGVLSELVNKDGSMKRLPDLKRFAAENSLTLINVNELINYRRLYDLHQSA